MTRRGKTSRGWRRVDMDETVVGSLLADLDFIASHGDIEHAHGHYDRTGRPRRIHAVFSDGWRLTLHLHLDGSYSLSQALKLRIGGPAAEAAQ